MNLFEIKFSSIDDVDMYLRIIDQYITLSRVSIIKDTL